MFFVTRHPKEAAGGRFCRLPSIRRKLPVAGSVGIDSFVSTYPKACLKDFQICENTGLICKEEMAEMISYSEQKLLESIVKNSTESLQDIHTVLGKVYDDELALDLNRQAAGYSSLKERAARRLLDTGIVPAPVGVLDRAKRWGVLKAKTALNINTGYVAGMLAEDEEGRRHDMEQAVREMQVFGQTSCELAEEFLDFEEKSIRILKTYVD